MDIRDHLSGLEGPEAADALFFGPFRLVTAKRLLLRDGEPVAIGARSLDLLIALTARAGETVSKQELMAQVWPAVTVDEGSLRVHMVGLRRALNDEGGDVRYVSTVAGRGYCFVAPVTRPARAAELAAPRSTPAQASSLPSSPVGMVGRQDDIEAIAGQLRAQRFVTILGPGGIGKTTVAVPVGHAVAASVVGAAYFVDLGPVSDPLLVPSALASTLGLLVQSSDPLGSLTTYLSDKRLLIILDSCEHVIDAAAKVAEAIHQRAPDVHILVTSREALRVQGESIYRLPPLATPPADEVLDAAQALSYPAVQLLVDRVTGSESTFKLTDSDTATACEICRKLDGMALAIELAAGRVGTFGIQQTARLLEGQFSLLWQGRRTALPRHQTLGATLDWSYDLLPEPERLMLRWLSAFSGHFTLEAIEAVMGGLAELPVLDGLASLVGKSLVVADTRGHPPLYRLLDTTRAYAEAKLTESGEHADIARRHARYFAVLLPRLNAQSSDLSKVQNFSLYAGHLGNVRSALEWSFGPDGDAAIGTELAAGAARMFLQLSLLTECHRWAAQAVSALDGSTQATRRELELQAALGQSVMFSKGNTEEVRTALLRGLELAEALGDLRFQLQLLGGLHIFHERIGDFATAMTFAQRSMVVAQALGDEGGIAAAHSFLGISLHLEGHHADAQGHVEASQSHEKTATGIHFGFDHRNRARITLARTLWIQGRCDEALEVAEHTVQEAARLEHPVTVCIALIWAISIHIWSGDWASAADKIGRFTEHAERHSLAPYYAVGRGVRGELAVRGGDPRTGVAALRSALAVLHADRYELLTTSFQCAIAEGQAQLGRLDEAAATIEATIAGVEENGDRFLLPELLRVRGELLAAGPVPDHAAAEAWFERARTMARAQGALCWELRAVLGLNRLLAGTPRRRAARELLADAVARMAEGADTADLRSARRLLADASPP